jgi:hypothetical protein
MLELDPLLAEQRGLVTRSQLLSAGVTPAAIRHRLGRSWRVILPGVVATFTGHLDPGQRLIAAQLFAGPSGVISSWTAAGWHGVEAASRSPVIRMTVPQRLSARRTSGIVITRTRRPDEAVWNRGSLRISSRARAVVDAARDISGEPAATAIVTEAEAKGREELGRLERERAILEGRITELRNFDRDYRQQLRTYIEGQLRDLETSANASGPTPVSAIGL